MKQSKRAAPDRVTPLIVGDIRYEGEEIWGSFGDEPVNAGTCHVKAYNTTTNELLWDSEIYTKTELDPNLEEDVQWSYITKISLTQEGKLLVINEDEEGYVVDASTGVVLGKN